MATTTRETIIANPARKAKKGGRMTAKQIKFFGSKRQKAALKAKRKKARPAAKKHRTRTKLNPSRKRKRTVTPVAAPKKRRKRKSGSAKKRATKRKNPGALYALMNPAKGPKKMARTKKRKASGKRNPAGVSRKRRNPARRRHSARRNPGALGKPMDWLSLGGGALVGGLGATSLPQMILGSGNNGAIGYLAMAASTGLLAVAASMVSKRNTMLSAGIIAGGAGALIRRVLQDYTPVGSYLNNAGMGDYVANWNFTTPQIIGGNGNTTLGGASPGTTPVSVAGVPSYGRALQNI